MSSPLDEYRKAQRALRQEFDAFTSTHCATCAQPCCVRPARIAPTDVLLAQGAGWRPPATAGDDPVDRAARQIGAALRPDDTQRPSEPCEYLGTRGCTFPRDLRPFGCTAHICPVMHRELDRKTLSRVRRLVRDLERAHAALIARLVPRHRQAPTDDD